MQHGTLLGGVDVFAAKHGVALVGHMGLAGQVQQGRPHRGVEGLAREVQMDAGAAGGGLHPLTARV